MPGLPHRFLRAVPVLLAAALASCAPPQNYANPDEPRFAGCFPSPPDSTEIRVVTFNIQFSKHIDEAIALLEGDPTLRRADILLVQEMDEPGVRRLAAALGMCFVYYPATIHPSTHRDFGNAILSKWPIEGDRKIILPHNGRLGKTQRIAVTGTVHVRGHAIQIYSVHLATWIEVAFNNRKDQARVVADDAEKAPGSVLVGGDINSHDVGDVFEDRHYLWPTRKLPHTTKNGTLDHFFLRGLSLRDSASVGVVKDNRGASDHKPVWMVLRMPADTAGATGAPASR
ncbi:MAG: endonuclease/exonuclease/phosphatase family protein [Candidatus Eiseniibacteriota bacterium]